MIDLPMAPILGGGFGRPQMRISGRMVARLACLLLLAAGAIQAASAAWIPVKAAAAQVLLDRAFDQSVERGEPVRPWPWADTAPLARVTVPRLGQSSVVLSGASGQALAFGPTQVPTTDARNVRILAAHRDTHFAFMADLREDDIVMLQGIDGETISYRITGFRTVRWDEFAVPRHVSGEWLALATCFPFDAQQRGPLRRVAWARAIR